MKRCEVNKLERCASMRIVVLWAIKYKLKQITESLTKWLGAGETWWLRDWAVNPQVPSGISLGGLRPTTLSASAPCNETSHPLRTQTMDIGFCMCKYVILHVSLWLAEKVLTFPKVRGIGVKVPRQQTIKAWGMSGRLGKLLEILGLIGRKGVDWRCGRCINKMIHDTWYYT